MIEEIFRKYLEIKSIDYLNEVEKPSHNYLLHLIEPKDFQLNKLEKNIIGSIDWHGLIKIGLHMFLTKIL